jgi:THO complex subunit 1
VDASFYRTFWGLQRWLANPPEASATPARLTEIWRDVRKVLDKFRHVKVTVTETPPGGSSEGGEIGVKYLTSPRVMGLQLKDATFRRHFLIQVLVLTRWAESPRLGDRAAAEGRSLEEIQDVKRRVYAMLEATPEKGAEFAAAIRGLMASEEAWIEWKKEKCPPEPHERAAAEPPAGADAAVIAPPDKKRKLSSDAVYGVRMGTEELDRLWNLTEDNVSSELKMREG